MLKTDKLAILLATYNGEKYIREQLNSLLAQTYTEWIAYMHDDGSTDGTALILDEYSTKYPNKFVVIDGCRTGGAKNNFYFLMRQVEAPYYMFCDQDDVWKAEKIELTLKKYNEEKVDDIPVMVYTDLSIVNADLEVVENSMWDFYKFRPEDFSINKILIRNTVAGCTILINYRLRNEMLKFKKVDNIPMHDKWAAMVSMYLGKAICLDESTIYYRQHSNNTVGVQNKSGVSYFLEKIRKIGHLKKSYEHKQKQAMEFVKIFDVPDDNIISIYASTYRMTRLNRVAVYLKYGLHTRSVWQTICQLVIG